MSRRETLWPWAALFAAFAGWAADRSGLLPAGWWFVPWASSLVLFGLPHGALDHVVILRLWRPKLSPGWALGVVLIAYLAASGSVVAAWFVAPTAMFAGFIGLTWAHWGLADLWWSWRRDPAYFASRRHRAVFAAWRGALPMLVPLAVDPGLYRRTAEATCSLFTRQPVGFHWLELPATRAAALLLALALGAADALLARPSPTRRLNLAEGAALLAFFGLLPALASIGLYFSFWHGLRHLLRLLASERLGWGMLARRAVPATLGALAMLGGLAFLVGRAVDPWQLVGVYLALIAALTVPHAVVVACLDAHDGLWQQAAATLRTEPA